MADNKDNIQKTNADVQDTTTSKTQNINGKDSNMSKKQEKMVPVFIPKESRNDTERFVSVNGENILVQTGKTVEVPERFAEVIKNSEKMARVSAEYIDKYVQS